MYTYAGDDPVNEWDPSGLSGWSWNPITDVTEAWSDTAGKLWDNGTVADVGACLGTQCYDTSHEGAVDLGNGFLNGIESLNPNQDQRVSIPAEYPCVPGAYEIGEGLTYLGIGAAGAAVPGLDEAEAAGAGADAGMVAGTAPEVGGASEARSIDQVLGSLRSGKTPPNLEVDTPAELQQIYDELSQGGTPFASTYPGTMVELPDGTRVGIRGVSKWGGPTVDVFRSNGTYVKVHLP